MANNYDMVNYCPLDFCANSISLWHTLMIGSVLNPNSLFLLLLRGLKSRK